MSLIGRTLLQSCDQRLLLYLYKLVPGFNSNLDKSCWNGLLSILISEDWDTGLLKLRPRLVPITGCHTASIPAAHVDLSNLPASKMCPEREREWIDTASLNCHHSTVNVPSGLS